MENSIEKNITLMSFAYLGDESSFINKKLKYLSEIAENEKWSFDDVNYPYSILKTYIYKTFQKCYADGLFIYSDDKEYCCFNTGLLTKYGYEIMMVFDKNVNYPAQSELEWHFYGFYNESETLYMKIFKDTIPNIAKYVSDQNELVFDYNAHIKINQEHILEDNWERVSKEIKLSKPIIQGLLNNAIAMAEKRIQRNSRLVVPQIYNGKLMFLIPLTFPINDTEVATMALAVEKIDDSCYHGNTIFTKESAYEKARLLMKPESNWLIEK